MMQRGENGMRAAKIFLFVILATVVAMGAAVWAVWPTGGPAGTLDEAVTKLRSQRNSIAKIVEIVKRDGGTTWVDPGIDIVKYTDADLTDPGTRRAVENYNAIKKLMIQSGFEGLDTLSDKHGHLKRVSFYVFGTGPLHLSKPIEAEWRASGDSEPLVHAKGKSCAAVDDGWYVCEVDY